MKASDGNNIQLNDNLVHFNSQSHSKDRQDGFDQARKTREALAEYRALGFPPVQLRLVK